MKPAETSTGSALLPDADELIRRAEAVTDLADWGGEALFEPWFRKLLPAICESLSHEADLTEAGLPAALMRLEAALEARLEFIDDRRRHPAIDQEQIVAPMIITGLPRSGTTFLHGLLARDPGNRAPLTYEMMFPTSQCVPAEVERRIVRTGKVFERLGILEPHVRALHPFGPTVPEEDHLMQEIVLLGDQFPAFWRMPTYMGVRAKLPRDIGWAVHRQVLQTLQYGSAVQRMLLKHPGHIFDIAGLLRTYPDARIIQTHRDPAKVIPSASALIGALRSAGSRSSPNPAKIARGNMEAFKIGLDSLIDLRADEEVNSHFVDVQFRDLVSDPLRTAARIYDAFGIELTADARAAMQAWLDDPSSKTPKGSYRLEDFGLDRAAVDRDFERYRNRFEIPLERA